MFMADSLQSNPGGFQSANQWDAERGGDGVAGGVE
jgi:hypothetical protein